MLIFLFAALAISAVMLAFYVIHEVRRQFREHPGILAGTEQPSYRQCIIVTAWALKQMVLPASSRWGCRSSWAWCSRNWGWRAVAGQVIGTIAGILGNGPEQRRWGVGQRQEIYRNRCLRWQRV